MFRHVALTRGTRFQKFIRLPWCESKSNLFSRLYALLTGVLRIGSGVHCGWRRFLGELFNTPWAFPGLVWPEPSFFFLRLPMVASLRESASARSGTSSEVPRVRAGGKECCLFASDGRFRSYCSQPRNHSPALKSCEDCEAADLGGSTRNPIMRLGGCVLGPGT